MTITLETLQACTLRHTAHLDGQGWFGDIHRCIQHPRLTRKTAYMRKDRSVQVTWRVDGQEVADLAAAAAALNVPPELDLVERELLARVPDEYVDLRRIEDITALLTLQDKGLIEFEAGKCRRRREQRDG